MRTGTVFSLAGLTLASVFVLAGIWELALEDAVVKAGTRVARRARL